MQLRNFMGLGETSWAGIRQYKKGFVIDSNDFFYWNQTNIGGGIEDMQLGQGKLSVAALHRDIADSYNNSVGDPIEDMIDSTSWICSTPTCRCGMAPPWPWVTSSEGRCHRRADRCRSGQP